MHMHMSRGPHAQGTTLKMYKEQIDFSMQGIYIRSVIARSDLKVFLFKVAQHRRGVLRGRLW